MANWHVYKCTWRGDGFYAVGDRMVQYGDVVVLDSREVVRKVRTSDITNGNLEYLGEVDAAGGFLSQNIQDFMDGELGDLKRNYLPMVVVDLPLADTDFDTATLKVVSDFKVQRRLMLDKVVLHDGALPAIGDGAGTLNLDNRVHLLVTKGDSGTGTQVTTNAYMDNNGTLGSLGLPASGATMDSLTYLQDAVYIGYTDKFAGIYVDMTTDLNGNGGYIYSVSYWNGTDWTAFANVADLTVRGSLPLAADGWIAWFEKPENWSTASPVASAHRLVNSGSALTDGVYWVAIQWKTDGSATTFDADTEINRVWVQGDEPLVELSITGVKNGELVIASREVFASVVWQDDTALVEVASATSAQITDWPTPNAADDALYVGYADPFGGIVVDVGTTVNSAASTLTASYWNGVEWVDISATDGTANGGDTFNRDGAITWSLPADWRAAVVTSAMMDSQTLPTTTTTDSMFWIRLTWGGNLTNLFDINRVYPLRSSHIPVEFNITANTELAPSEFINVYVGEIEAETDALTAVTLQLVGADI